jgi:hypothetical protein
LEENGNILVLEVHFEIIHGLFELFVLKHSVSIDVKGLKETLEAKKTALSSLHAFLSDAI